MASARGFVRLLCVSSLIAGCAPPEPLLQKGERTGEARGDRVSDPAVTAAAAYTEWLFSGQIDSLWSSLSDHGRERFPTPDSLSAFRSVIVAVLPRFESLVADSVQRTDSLVTVWRHGVNERDGAEYYVWWRLTPEDHRVTAVGARDAGRAAATPMLDYEPRTRLRLPFEGEWIVVWGGRTAEENYHAAYPHQRFALDLLPVADSARVFRAAQGEPMRLSDFVCFGATLVAPAEGRIVVAVDTVPDNVLGQFHPTSELGNHIVIEHLPDEFSLLAHLRQGSIRGKVGDKVDAADAVAECGNSGRSTAPHLHYDLRNSAEVIRGTYSLPARFSRFLRDSTFVGIGELGQWQRIQPIP
jgi:hypothetical protein